MTTLSARWLLRRIFQSDICIRTTISKSGWRTVKQIILRTNCFQSGFRSRRFLGGVGVEFLTVLGVGVGFFCPTPDVQLGHFLHHTHKLGISVEMAEFLLKLLLKQISCCVPRFPLILTSKFPSCQGVGNLTYDAATLLSMTARCAPSSKPGWVTGSHQNLRLILTAIQSFAFDWGEEQTRGDYITM